MLFLSRSPALFSRRMNARFVVSRLYNMVRVMHAQTSRAVDAALVAAVAVGLPFLLFVYSNNCGHCVRMMPAFQDTLALLGVETRHDVVQLSSDALRQESRGPHPLRKVIMLHANGVPFVAVMKPLGGKSGFAVVPLPDSSDRSAESLSAFAHKHLVSKTGSRLKRGLSSRTAKTSRGDATKKKKTRKGA